MATEPEPTEKSSQQAAPEEAPDKTPDKAPGKAERSEAAPAGREPVEQAAPKPADKPADKPAGKPPAPRRARGETIALVRTRVARLVGLVCVLAALVLAVGVALVALRKNVTETNDVVRAVYHLADVVDGPFSREHGVFSFAGETKNALANWGLAAVVWLVLGRVLSGVIAPKG